MVIKAAELTDAKTLQIIDEYSSLQRFMLVKDKREQLAEIGLYAGYPFKGFGCTKCYNQIVNDMYSGKLADKIKRKTIKQVEKKSTMKNFKFTNLGESKTHFQVPKEGVGIVLVPKSELTDEDVKLIISRVPGYLGLLFEAVAEEKPKRTRKAKTEE